MGREQYREDWVGQVAILTMSGDLDMLTVPRLDEAVRASLAKEPLGLIVDLTELEFLASAGMQLLIGIHNEITPGVWLLSWQTALPPVES